MADTGWTTLYPVFRKGVREPLVFFLEREDAIEFIKAKASPPEDMYYLTVAGRVSWND